MADIRVNIDVNTAEALTALTGYEKANQRVAAQLGRTTAAQAKYDAAVAASGKSSNTAIVAQQKLGAALAKTVEAERAAEIQSLKLSEAQARQAAAATAAADKQAAALTKANVARKQQAASLVSSATGFSVAQTGALALGAAFVYAAKSAADFDSKMATLRSLSKDSTVGQLAQIREASFGYADIGVSASEAADAEIELTKAGIGVKDQLSGALSGALTLAAAGQMDYGEATEIAAGAMTAFQLQGKDIPHLADLLAAAADKSLGSVSDLGEGLKYAALPAHQLGLTIDETVGGLAEFAAAGLKGSQGGTALQMMLQRLIKPTKEASALMDQYNIHLYDAQGGFVGLSNLAGQLHDNLGGLTLAQRQTALATIFSARAARGAAILYQDGADGVQEWTNKVDDAGFAANQTRGKMDSLTGDLKKLKATFDNLATKQGEGAQSPLRALTKELTALLDVADSSAVSKFMSVFGPTGYFNPVGWATKAVDFAPKGFDFAKDHSPWADKKPQQIDLFGGLDNVATQTSSAIQNAQSAAANTSRAMGGAMLDTAGSAKTYADAMGIAGNETDALGFSAKQLGKALQANQNALDQRDALRAYTDAVKAVDKAQKSAKTTSRQMNEALDGQAQSVLNVAATMGGSAKQVARYLNNQRDALYQQARQFGLTRDEANDYVTSVLRIPGEKNTDVRLYAEEAQRRIDQLLRSYNALKDKTVIVTANIREATGFTPGGHVVYDGQALAGGGEVRGTGTGTSDSNLIRASKGEHMLASRDVSAMGGQSAVYAFRQALHSRYPRYDVGGAVGAAFATRAASGSGGSRTVYMTDPALLAAVRRVEDRLAAGIATTETHPERIAAGMQSIARGEVDSSAQRDARMRRMRPS